MGQRGRGAVSRKGWCPGLGDRGSWGPEDCGIRGGGAGGGGKIVGSIITTETQMKVQYRLVYQFCHRYSQGNLVSMFYTFSFSVVEQIS